MVYTKTADDIADDVRKLFTTCIPRDVAFNDPDESDKYIYQHINNMDNLSREELESLYYASIQRLILTQNPEIIKFFYAEYHTDTDLKASIKHIYKHV